MTNFVLLLMMINFMFMAYNVIMKLTDKYVRYRKR